MSVVNPPNLFAIAALMVGLLLMDGGVNSRSPVEVAKAIVSGKPLPAKGSGKNPAAAPATPQKQGPPVP